MKTEDSHAEIGDLLRSRKPETAVPPGLEGRILRAVGEQRHRRNPIHWWHWLLLPPAAALLMVVFSPQGKEDLKPVVTGGHDPEPMTNRVEAVEAKDDRSTATVNTMNPLERESQALKRDAERAGRFLLDCLPSVNSATEKR